MVSQPLCTSYFSGEMKYFADFLAGLNKNVYLCTRNQETNSLMAR